MLRPNFNRSVPCSRSLPRPRRLRERRDAGTPGTSTPMATPVARSPAAATAVATAAASPAASVPRPSSAAGRAHRVRRPRGRLVGHLLEPLRRHRPAQAHERFRATTLCRLLPGRARDRLLRRCRRRLRDLDDAGGRHEADAAHQARRPRPLPGHLARRDKFAFAGAEGSDAHTEIYVVDAATGAGLVAAHELCGRQGGLRQRLPGVVARREADRVHPPGRLRRRRTGSTSRSGS